MGLKRTIAAAAISVVAYTAATAAQTYWLIASISLLGSLLLFLTGMTIVSFILLSLLAMFCRDVRILLPHHDVAQRRLFCCTLCGGTRGKGVPVPPFLTDESLPPPHTSAITWPQRLTWVALTQTEVLFLMGVNNGAAAILQWYATPPTRQPPLIAALLPSLALLAAPPLSQFALGDARVFLSPTPLAAFALILAALVVSLLPAALAGGGLAGSESSTDVLAWTFLNCISQIPSAMAFVGSQAYLARAGAHAAGAGGQKALLVGVGRFVAYNQLAVTILTLSMFWVDVVPWFGSEHSFGELSNGVLFSVQCSVLGPSGTTARPPPGAGTTADACPARTPLWALLALAPYALYLGGSALVSLDSAVFSNVLSITQGAAIALFFFIPGTNPAPSATPAWSVILALLLSTAGMALYKTWETRLEGEGEGGGGAAGSRFFHAKGLGPVPDSMHDGGCGKGDREMDVPLLTLRALN